MTHPPTEIQAAEVLLQCTDLIANLTFFTKEMGFDIDSIFPADDPSIAQISGYGLRLRLERSHTNVPTEIRLLTRATPGPPCSAPNGTVLSFHAHHTPLHMPPLQPGFVLTRLQDNWVTGRAGMQYRDLIPDRQGGCFIASHIRIPNDGPVPDYVHYHKVLFQMIYCLAGEVEVVYEDQGPAFVLRPGDCVLQPPQIRHRVLNASNGLEVLEIGCPADHETHTDRKLTLPNNEINPKRDFEGSRFLRYHMDDSPWQPWWVNAFVCRELGYTAATQGLATVNHVRSTGPIPAQDCTHYNKLTFIYVLKGMLQLTTKDGETHNMSKGDSAVLAPGESHQIAVVEPMEMLEVRIKDKNSL